MQAELGTICFLISAFSRKNQMGADIFTNGEIDGVMLAIGIGILCVSLMAAFFKYRKKGSGGLTDSKHFVYKSLEMPKNGRCKALLLCRCDNFVTNDENACVLCGENDIVRF